MTALPLPAESPMAPTKYIVGNGHLLEWALAAWAEVEPGTTLHAIDVGQDSDYRFDLQALDRISAQGATAFAPWNSQFLNFRRLELMGELKARGFRMPPLVCRTATVAANVRIGENSMVGAGAVVEAGCQIGINCRIGALASIGPASRLGNSAWLADGVRVGATARIEANAILGWGVIVQDGVTIGRQCVLDVEGRRALDMPAKTFISHRFPAGAVIVDNGGD